MARRSAGVQRPVVVHQAVAAGRTFQHDQRRALAHGDRCRPPRGRQPPGLGRQLGVERRRFLQRPQEQRRHGRLDRGVGRLEDRNPEPAQQLRHGAGERRRVVRLRPVVAFQPRQHPVAELGGVGLVPDGVEQRPDRVVQALPVERRERRVGRPRRQVEAPDVVGRGEQMAVRRFGVVVIVARHPEHRHHRVRERGLQPPRDGGRAEGLVERVQRAGEEARLLPGGDAQGAPREQALHGAPRGVVGQERVAQGGRRAPGGRCPVRRRRAARGQRRGAEFERHCRHSRMNRGAPASGGRPR
jgi:hypothetical protein